jgi:hypothetical protein
MLALAVQRRDEARKRLFLPGVAMEMSKPAVVTDYALVKGDRSLDAPQ